MQEMGFLGGRSACRFPALVPLDPQSGPALGPVPLGPDLACLEMRCCLHLLLRMMPGRAATVSPHMPGVAPCPVAYRACLVLSIAALPYATYAGSIAPATLKLSRGIMQAAAQMAGKDNPMEPQDSPPVGSQPAGAAGAGLSVLRAGGFFRQGLRRLFDFAVPPQCLLCDTLVDRNGGCCASCWSRLRFITRPYCEVMGTPFPHDGGEGFVSAEAIAHPPPFRRLRAAMVYDEPARRLVSALKYSDRTEFAPWMAGWMRVAGRELIAEKPLIVPVPLHRSRLLQRRFNQSAELGRHIAAATNCPFEPGLVIRHRRTGQQVGLNQRQRERNVQGAFRVPPARQGSLAGRKVLVVDDVYTSGATVKAVCRALKRGGAAAIDVLVFAKVETLDEQALYC